MKALRKYCKGCALNGPAGLYRLTVILVGWALALCLVGCTHRVKPSPVDVYTPSKAPTEALIDSCENVSETQEVRCPLQVFLKGIYNFADLWEYSQKCGYRLVACEKFGAVNLAEMQGHLNKQTARADKNARWITYTVIGGAILAVASFVVGAVAF